MDELLLRYRKAITGGIQSSTVEQLLGIKPVSIAPGQVLFEMRRPRATPIPKKFETDMEWYDQGGSKGNEERTNRWIH